VLDSTNHIKSWGTPRSHDEELEVEVADDHPFFTDDPFCYMVNDGVLEKCDDQTLKNAKKMKDMELNKACNEAILSGFTYEIDGVVYWFSYDIEAQINWREAYGFFEEGAIDYILWTARLGDSNGEYVRVEIDKKVMKKLYPAIVQHKVDSIARYRDVLLPMVDACTTVEEVNAISWDMTAVGEPIEAPEEPVV